MSQTLIAEPVQTQLSLGPFFVPAGVGPFLDLGNHHAYVKINSQATNGEFLFADLFADYLGGVPLHVHHREDETFAILEGHWEFVIGNDRVEAGPGDTVFGPRNTPHSWQCISPQGGRAMFLCTPSASFETFINLLVEAVQTMQSGEMVDVPALARRYDIDMLAGPESLRTHSTVAEAGAVA